MFNIDSNYFNASYGIVPKHVLAYHRALLDECERNPYRWFTDLYAPRLAELKMRLAPYIGAEPSDFVFVDNSTSAANSVFDSLYLDETSAIIVLETAYGVIKNLVSKMGCRVVTIPVDVMRLDKLIYRVAEAITELDEFGFCVSLVCLDHISSAPGIVFPVGKIAEACKAHGVPVLVDAAHALGQVRINLRELEESGVTYWFTDAHKWFFSPKGSAILWVCKRKHARVRPAIDCAYLSTREGQTQTFDERFAYLGTKDYTPWLSVGAAIDFVESVGGYDKLIERNRKLAIWCRDFLSVRLHSVLALEDAVTASMCNVHLSSITCQESADALHGFLRDKGFEVIVCEYPKGCFWLRLCMQLFVTKSSIQDLWLQLQSFFAASSAFDTVRY